MTAIGRIEHQDPHFAALVPAGTLPEVVAEFDNSSPHWLEGPVWDVRDGTLLFSDVKANLIRRWSSERGVDIFREPSGYTGDAPYPRDGEPGSNGLAFDGEGRLIICEHGDRRVRRVEADGSLTVLADRFEGRRLNSPNDIVPRSNGEIWFTDPPYGLPKKFEDPDRQLAGIYRLSPDGDLTLVRSDLRAPNGIAFSPDERILYVGESGETFDAWLALPVREDGGLGNPRVFFDVTGMDGLGGPDGLVVDRDGVVFAAGREAVFVIAPAGTLLGTIFTEAITSNVAWGEDGSTLFITTERRLLRVRLSTTGAGF